MDFEIRKILRLVEELVSTLFDNSDSLWVLLPLAWWPRVMRAIPPTVVWWLVIYNFDKVQVWNSVKLRLDLQVLIDIEFSEKFDNKIWLALIDQSEWWAHMLAFNWSSLNTIYYYYMFISGDGETIWTLFWMW